MPTHLPPALAAREHAHRRTLLLGISALTLLSVSPVVGHHVSSATATLFQGTDHIGELCLVALHRLLAPVHELFHVLLVVGLAYAAWDRARAWWRMHRVLAPLAIRPAVRGDPFWKAARRSRLNPTTLRIVDGLPNPAFTVGWWRPHVYVARHLADWLTDEQLAAVIAHEGAHVARRDPLRLSVLRAFALALFWLPALRRLADDVADEAEVQADDRAAGEQPLVLAAAILSVAARGAAMTGAASAAPPPVAAVAFDGRDILERRVRRLAGEDVSARTHVTRRSILAAAVALAAVWLSGAVMAHPLPAAEPPPAASAVAGAATQHPADCSQHEGPVILHLFCDGLSFGSMHHHCPHAQPAAVHG